MKTFFIGIFLCVSSALSGELTIIDLGKKVCNYTNPGNNEHCLENFLNKERAENVLEEVLFGCADDVNRGKEKCLKELIVDKNLIYQPTRNKLKKYLRHRSGSYGRILNKCDGVGSGFDRFEICMKREIDSFLSVVNLYELKLNLVQIVSF